MSTQSRREQIEKAAKSYPSEYELIHMNADTPRLSGAEYLIWGFKKGCEWADQFPCLHSWEPDTAMTKMRCEWCGIEADRISEKKRLQAKLDIAVRELEEALIQAVNKLKTDYVATPLDGLAALIRKLKALAGESEK